MSRRIGPIHREFLHAYTRDSDYVSQVQRCKEKPSKRATPLAQFGELIGDSQNRHRRMREFKMPMPYVRRACFPPNRPPNFSNTTPNPLKYNTLSHFFAGFLKFE